MHSEAMPCPRLRLPALLTSFVVLIGVHLVASAPSASALENGLGVTNHSRYVVDPEAGTVSVSQKVTLTNQHPDSGRSYYYWNAYAFPAPPSAAGVSVTSSGSKLSFSTQASKTKGINLIKVSFPALRYGHSRTIELTYKLATAKYRSDDWARVGKGFASFPVWSEADPGHNTIEIVAPNQMEFTASSESFTASTSTPVTYTSTEVNARGYLDAQISLIRRDLGERRTIKVDGQEVELIAFPGDTAWLNFVEAEVPKALGELKKIIGVPVPKNLRTIREDAGLQTLGYDGSFSASESEIKTSEALDQTTLYHELTHLWMHGGQSDARWISEGFAQVLSERAVKAVGGSPRTYPADRGSKDAIPLAEWDRTDRATSADDYAYPASDAAVSELLSGLTDAQLVKVTTAVANHESDYQTAWSGRGPDDWQMMLDLVQSAGPGRVDAHGKDVAEGAVGRWIVKTLPSDLLAKRATARRAYAAVASACGSWTPPLAVRSPMATWEFDSATQNMDASSAACAKTSLVDKAASSAGREVPKDLTQLLSLASDGAALKDVDSALTSTATALNAIATGDRDKAGSGLPTAVVAAELLGIETDRSGALSALTEGHYSDAATIALRRVDRARMIMPVEGALAAGLAAALVVTLLLVRRARRPRSVGASMLAPSLASAPLLTIYQQDGPAPAQPVPVGFDTGWLPLANSALPVPDDVGAGVGDGAPAASGVVFHPAYGVPEPPVQSGLVDGVPQQGDGIVIGQPEAPDAP